MTGNNNIKNCCYVNPPYSPQMIPRLNTNMRKKYLVKKDPADTSSLFNAAISDIDIQPTQQDVIDIYVNDFWKESAKQSDPSKVTAIAQIYSGLVDGSVKNIYFRKTLEAYASHFTQCINKYKGDNVEVVGKILGDFLKKFSVNTTKYDYLMNLTILQLNHVKNTQSIVTCIQVKPASSHEIIQVSDLPITLPSLGDVDPLSILPVFIKFGLSKIPAVGLLISGLFGFFWDMATATDIWDQIKDKVEAAIHSAIEAAVYSLLKAKLEGIGNVVKLYLKAIENDDSENIRNQFTASNTYITGAISEFQNPDHEWSFLPLFVLVATFHLTLLRDAALFGLSWGVAPKVAESYMTDASEKVDKYIAYVDRIYNLKAAEAESSFHPTRNDNNHRVAHWNHVQDFYNGFQLAVKDISEYFPYFDPIKYPRGDENLRFSDEITSRAWGTADDWDATCNKYGSYVSPRKTDPIANITSVYVEQTNTGGVICSVNFPSTEEGYLNQVSSGIVREPVSDLISNYLSGKETATYLFDQDDPIVQVDCREASMIESMSLRTKSGRHVNLWNKRHNIGGTDRSYGSFLDGRICNLWSLYTHSIYGNNCAGALIVSASRDNVNTEKSTPLKKLEYISAFPKNNPDVIPEWDTQRTGHWHGIMN